MDRHSARNGTCYFRRAYLRDADIPARRPPRQHHSSTDANGTVSASALYKAFGELRITPSDLGTDYKFTGQREEANLGIYFFNARWYDSSMGRFTSPDTIVPTGTQGTQAWDRYAFVNNNPVRYTDPTGHMIDSESEMSSRRGHSEPVCMDPSATNYRGYGSCAYSSSGDGGGGGGTLDLADDDDGKCAGLCAPTLPNNPSGQDEVTLRKIALGFAIVGGLLLLTAILLSPPGLAFLASIGLIAAGTTVAASTVGLVTALGGLSMVIATIVTYYANLKVAEDKVATAVPTSSATPTAPHGAPFILVTPTLTPIP